MRPYNFSAGPAAIPESVLQQAAREMLDWCGSGMGVMEMSHRGKEFGQIHARALTDLRELLAVPEHFEILFMQGGGLAENAIVPLNLAHTGWVDVVDTGAWSRKSATEAARYAQVNVAARTDGRSGLTPPCKWSLSSAASYLHLCGNETIDGVEFHALPDLAALGYAGTLVLDFSSHVLSRTVDWTRVGLAFGGAQKNIGPAGLTVVIVRKDLLGRALAACPSAFNYQVVAQNNSMYNTPPTYSIYVAGLVFQWLKAQGGVEEMERRAAEKSALLYGAIDVSHFYSNPVHVEWRSRMNVPFFLADETRNDAFLAGAKNAGLLQLKGHKSVGGMRASIYNAMPLAGVQALVHYMQEFERKS